MPSHAIHVWDKIRVVALDEIENAHRSVGGSGPGRRYATQQINQAYAVLLSSQFQGFCRDLHRECIDHLVRVVIPIPLASLFRPGLARDRKLDRGNPNPGNIGSDFNRFGIDFWAEVSAADPRAGQRRSLLTELNEWRNAIAHQDFDPSKLGGTTTLRLSQVRNWRAACQGLAVSFDSVMRVQLST